MPNYQSRLMKLYLDNCSFNRPFDDQSKLRIMLESEAKLAIQQSIRSGKLELIWSYIMDYENNKNPFQERREQIQKWKEYAAIDIDEDESVLKTAHSIGACGLKQMDSLHLACAITGTANYFVTTDDKILKKCDTIREISIIDPIDFIKQVSL